MLVIRVSVKLFRPFVRRHRHVLPRRWKNYHHPHLLIIPQLTVVVFASHRVSAPNFPPLPHFPASPLCPPTPHFASSHPESPVSTPDSSATPSRPFPLPYHHIPWKFCCSNSRIMHASCSPCTGLYTSTLIAYKRLARGCCCCTYTRTRRYGSSREAHRYHRRSCIIEVSSFVDSLMVPCSRIRARGIQELSLRF